jgi:hypothetical protein
MYRITLIIRLVKMMTRRQVKSLRNLTLHSQFCLEHAKSVFLLNHLEPGIKRKPSNLQVMISLTTKKKL